MSKEDLQLSFSSISLATSEISKPHEILWPRFVTQAIVTRAEYLQKVLGPIFGEENVGLSVHPAMVVDVPQMQELLLETGIPVTSIDIPDVVPPEELVDKVLESLRNRDGRFFNHIGWSLQNVLSEEQRKRKLKQGIAVMQAHSEDAPLIVRASSSDWIDSTKGEVVWESLSVYQNAILALEIDPHRQTPAQYGQLLTQLRAKGVRAFADADLGKFKQSQHIHRDNQIEDPLTLLTSLLTDLDSRGLNMVATVTFNQFLSGNVETHVNILHGPINLSNAATALGKATTAGTLPFGPAVVVESHPSEYGVIAGTEGIAFFQRIRRSFDAGRGIPPFGTVFELDNPTS